MLGSFAHQYEYFVLLVSTAARSSYSSQLRFVFPNLDGMTWSAARLALIWVTVIISQLGYYCCH